MERSGTNRYNDYGCLDKGRFTSDDRSGRPSCTFTFEDRSTGMNSRSLFLSDGKDVADTTSSEKRISEPSLALSGAKVDMPWSCSLFESNNKGDELLSAVSRVQSQREADLANDQHGVLTGASGASGRSSIGLGIAKQSCSEVQGGIGSSTAGPLSAASHSAPTKKLRSTGQTPRCQVEGCKTDLASAKDYHRRHKVCAVHSKAARVIVAGQEQRFCQQCSRFHGLSEFDEGKRSCRRRLAGHNERRRKPQPDPLTLSARFLSPFQDSRRMGHLFSDRSAFLSPRIAGVSALWDEQEDFYTSQRKVAWPRMFKYENQASFEYPHPGTGVERHLFFPGRPQHSNDRSSLLLPQSPKCTVPLTNDVTGQRTHHYLQGSVGPIGQSVTLMPSSGAGVLSGLEAIPIGQGFHRVSDSGCALSLQSTTQLWPSQAPVAVSLDTMTMHTGMLSDQATDQIPFAQPIVHGQQHHLDWPNEKLLSSSIGTSSASEYTGGVSHVLGKGHLEAPFTHGLNNVGNYDGHSLLGMFPGDVSGGEGRVSSYELKYRA